MNDHEIVELSQIIAEALANLRPEDIKPWLAGFVTTHPQELVKAVNTTVRDDERYKDAIHRVHGWTAGSPKSLVSWSHVTPETEASLRMAASWASSPLASRNQFEKHTFRGSAESASWTAHKAHIGLPEQTVLAKEASSFWNNRALLNKNGVALSDWTSATPWAGEVADLVASKLPRSQPIVLCSGGRIVEGLRTWPRV